MDEALEIINRLLDGERLDHEGRFYRTKAAYLHTRGERRPPVYVSAFGPARGRRCSAPCGDGLWTLADPEQAPGIIDAYRGAVRGRRQGARRDHPPGRLLVGGGRRRRAGGMRAFGSPPRSADYFTDDWHDPRAMYERAENEVSDDDFREAYIVSSDPEVHAERVREVERLGATVVCLQNGSGAAPEQALRVYGEQVLPAVRGARV